MAQMEKCPVCGKPGYCPEGSLGFPITFLPASPGLIKRLIDQRIYTIEALEHMTDQELLGRRCIGPDKLKRIRMALSKFKDS